jgi:hypothetical protein
VLLADGILIAAISVHTIAGVRQAIEQRTVRQKNLPAGLVTERRGQK